MLCVQTSNGAYINRSRKPFRRKEKAMGQGERLERIRTADRRPDQLYLLQFSLRMTDLWPPEAAKTRTDSHSKKEWSS